MDSFAVAYPITRANSYALTRALLGGAAPQVLGLIAAGSGNFLFTGDTALLAVQRTLAAAAGSFVFTGQAASLLASSKTIAAGAGAFLLTGDSMTPVVDYKLPADSGSFALTGQAATLTKAGGSPPAYVFRGSNNTNSSSATQSASIDIGTAAADRLVIVFVDSQNAPTVTSVVVNGVTLTQRAFDNTNATAGIFDGIVSAGNGAQTVTVTWSVGGFLDRDFCVWTATGLTTGFITATANPGDTATTSVQSGDLVFAGARTGVIGDWSTSDEAPFSIHTLGTNGTAADWTISSTDASFVVRPNGAGTSPTVVGVYR